MLALSNIAQGSAALAMMFIVKDEKQKGLSLTSGISAYLGITEPALFGVNLRYRFPFVIAMISSGIAGMFISSQGVLARLCRRRRRTWNFLYYEPILGSVCDRNGDRVDRAVCRNISLRKIKNEIREGEGRAYLSALFPFS